MPHLTEAARDLRTRGTDAERRLWRLLRARQLGGAKFRRQHPVPPWVADFACVEAGLVVELDGSQHAGSVRDIARDADLARRGWRVLRFWNEEALTNPTGVAERILAALQE